MHELALMESMFKVAESYREKNKLKEVTEVKVVVGELNSILPEAFSFAFEVLKRQTPFEQARLIIEIEEAEAICSFCGKKFRPEYPWFTCPVCQHAQAQIIKGNRMYIEYLEGVKEEEEK
jgi:hydrogenase nickel incorporation protein HypA/HybF